MNIEHEEDWYNEQYELIEQLSNEIHPEVRHDLTIVILNQLVLKFWELQSKKPPQLLE